MRAYAQYELGHTAVIAAESDRRASYALYVPQPARELAGLLVCIHGSYRDFEACRQSPGNYSLFRCC